MTTQLGIDPVPHEGVRGYPVQLSYLVTDNGQVADLTDVTAFTVKVKRRAGYGSETRPTVEYTLEDGDVVIDTEAAQITCTLDEAATTAMEAGAHDVEWEAEVEGEAQPTWLLSILNLREGL